MILFNSDYLEGAAPEILERLGKTNLEQTPGYEEDEYCRQAADAIRSACDCEDGDVHFLMGGTQTNMTVIAAALRPWQGVIAADTGHINVHETGAIESTGHKVIVLPGQEGKITAGQIDEYMELYWEDHSFEHVVQPGMVYLSQPTELGTLYSRQEMIDISRVCKRRDLYLYVDGARMGYGLAADSCDFELPFLAEYTDVFYIGGTKVGALFGEAVVITNETLKKDFRYMMKQKGGLMAKGRLLGVQFLTLFTDDLYFRLGAHGIAMADKLRKGLVELGVPFYMKPVTNQLFIRLPDEVCEQLQEDFGFDIWERDEKEHETAIRLCTSWATPEENIEQLLDRLEELYL